MQAFGGALSARCPHLGRMGCRSGTAMAPFVIVWATLFTTAGSFPVRRTVWPQYKTLQTTTATDDSLWQ